MQVNSETDFATKTDQFRDMMRTVASAALNAEASGMQDKGSLQNSTFVPQPLLGGFDEAIA